MFELRDYQAEAITMTRARLAEGHRPIICAPTGSGKTVIAGHLAREANEQSQRVLFMSGRQEILRQTFDTFQSICGGDKVGFLMGNFPGWWFYPPITVASWDTLKSRWDKDDGWKIPAELVLVDECHLALSDRMSKTIMPHYAPQTVIGFTATPARRSGKGLGDYFTRIIQVKTVQQLIDGEFLAPCEYWAGSHADVSKVKTVNGDYDNKGLSRAANDNALIGDVIDNWLRIARDRHTIVFAVDIAHATALTARFQTAGVLAEAIHSKTEPQTRTRLTEQFKSRQFQVLVNVGIATYGYDVPSVNCIVLARPTKSIVLHLQMIGRGMRPKPDGDYCMVLDHADNVRRLGCAEDLIRWRLDSGKPAAANVSRDAREKKGALVTQTTCEQCNHIFSRSRVCPKCGWEKPFASREVETIEADLVKIAKAKKDLKLEGLDRCAWFRMIRGWVIEYKHKEGAAYYAYRDKFGEEPDRNWWSLSPLEPDDRVHAYMMHRMILFAKSKR